MLIKTNETDSFYQTVFFIRFIKPLYPKTLKTSVQNKGNS